MVYPPCRSALLGIAVMLSTSACAPAAEAPEGEGEAVATLDTPHLMGGTDVERGRYIAVVAGCNDCHTDGYLQANGDVPESAWLAGSPVGYRGPWGTSYAADLRRTVATVSEDDWVEKLRQGAGLPPMPWMNVRHMAESDMRAMYRYVATLGDPGPELPVAIGPEVEPTTPYISLAPIIPAVQ